MGRYVKDLVTGMTMNPMQYKISATMVAGQVVIREATLTDPGEVEDPTTTAALNCMGCTEEAATYSATQGDAEGLVRLIPQPYGIWEFLISGGAGASVAFPAGAPALILTNATAETAGTTIADADVGTINMAGGLLKGRTGANAGVIRKAAAHTDNTSTVTTVPFPSDIAVDATFLRVPWSRTGLAMQLTTALTQANGIIATGTGIPVQVYDVILNELDDTGVVQVVFRTHYHSSLA